MRDTTFIEPAPVMGDRLRLFSLYVDFPAGIRAKWLTSQITKSAVHRGKLSAEMWKLDVVTPIGPIKEMTSQEAAESDLLVIAVTSLDQRQLAVVHWLDSLVALKGDRPAAGVLVGLLGDDEHQAGDLEWMVHQLAVFARRTNMDFVWRWMGVDAVHDSSWVTETIENLLARKEAMRCLQHALATPSHEVPNGNVASKNAFSARASDPVKLAGVGG